MSTVRVRRPIVRVPVTARNRGAPTPPEGWAVRGRPSGENNSACLNDDPRHGPTLRPDSQSISRRAIVGGSATQTPEQASVCAACTTACSRGVSRPGDRSRPPMSAGPSHDREREIRVREGSTCARRGRRDAARRTRPAQDRRSRTTEPGSTGLIPSDRFAPSWCDLRRWWVSGRAVAAGLPGALGSFVWIRLDRGAGSGACSCKAEEGAHAERMGSPPLERSRELGED